MKSNYLVPGILMICGLGGLYKWFYRGNNGSLGEDDKDDEDDEIMDKIMMDIMNKEAEDNIEVFKKNNPGDESDIIEDNMIYELGFIIHNLGS